MKDRKTEEQNNGNKDIQTEQTNEAKERTINVKKERGIYTDRKQNRMNTNNE